MRIYIYRIIFTILCVQNLSGQILELVLKSGDMIASRNKYTIENRSLVFWKDSIAVLAIPVMTIDGVYYSTKTYKALGVPFQVIGGFVAGSAMAASVAGQSDYLAYGLPTGLLLYAAGRRLNYWGRDNGRDEIFYDFYQLGYANRIVIFESIQLDINRKNIQNGRGYFNEGPEGETPPGIFKWDGRKVWEKWFKRKKRKWVEFS
ncbi:MAG: hypothetical protein ISR83_01745 [Candidatus Marinimicrobia bacterium]|nr:hypothetical protein [Candidatus Neomarinimicrobiota bacterium]